MATANFNGTNGTALVTHNANFSLVTGNFQLRDNALESNVGGGAESAARWNANTFNNDQYATATVVNVGTAASDGVGLAVRCSSSATTYYGMYFTGSLNMWLFKVITGSWTQLGSAVAVPADNDVLRLEVEGTTLRPTKNGSSTGTPGNQTDSAIASGSGGVSGWGSAGSSTNQIDNWEAGNLGAAAATSLLPLRRPRMWRYKL